MVLAIAPRTASQDQPPKKQGGRAVHDPSTIVKHGDTYWLFATGRGVSSLRSKDLVTWEAGPAVFDEPPKWVAEVVPGNRGHFWAPDVIRHDDRYLLYYSVSTFGKNTSAIALASNPTLDPADPKYKWTDHGVVIRSGPKDDFNAIDPQVVRGPDGTLWMAFGSFWSGIKLVELDPKTGLRIAADSPIHALAQKEQIEAVALYRHGEYYYQFVNWGWCCRGVKSTYNMRVGRAKEITGPYLDKEGKDLLKGGGTLLLETEGASSVPGTRGCSRTATGTCSSYHFYDRDANGRAALAIRVAGMGRGRLAARDGQADHAGRLTALTVSVAARGGSGGGLQFRQAHLRVGEAGIGLAEHIHRLRAGIDPQGDEIALFFRWATSTSWSATTSSRLPSASARRIRASTTSASAARSAILLTVPASKRAFTRSRLLAVEAIRSRSDWRTTGSVGSGATGLAGGTAGGAGAERSGAGMCRSSRSLTHSTPLPCRPTWTVMVGGFFLRMISIG